MDTVKIPEEQISLIINQAYNLLTGPAFILNGQLDHEMLNHIVSRPCLILSEKMSGP